MTLTPSIGTRTGPGVGTQNFSTTIVQQPGEDGAALANRFLRALRDKARSQTGDTLDFGRFPG